MTLSNPRDLFLQLLAEVLWLERTLVRAVLPKLAEQAQSESLAGAFAAHLEQTRGHAANVERVFELLGAETSSSLDEAAEKLAEHHDATAGSIVDPRLRDVFHAAAAARTEHYELASYDALIGLGRALDVPEAVELLGRNRADEADALAQVEAIGARIAGELASR